MTHGFAFAERALMRGERVAPERLDSLRGWYPVAATGDQVGWRWLGGKRFSEPFFSDTLADQPRQSRLVCQTPYAALAQFDDVLAPSAFIFHVSRCGSTLLTQSLAALAHCVVLSEPPVLDAFLRERGQGGLDAAGLAVFRQLVGALGQRRGPGESAFVIKFDSWHIASLAAVRRAFPDTPCIFLYREPDAVLASHRRRRGPQMVPGMIDPARLGIDGGARAPGDLDAYCIAVLEQFYTAALAQAGAAGLMLLNYNELPGAVPALLARLGIACSAQEGAAIRARAAYHSKDAGLPFGGDPDGAPMHGGATLAAAYARLEQMRLEQMRLEQMRLEQMRLSAQATTKPQPSHNQAITKP
ncbi:aspartyl beta-hydroxylase [Massilia glaciei]|uniref:Aspartyl beta-hydroxylase n=1 Tax=Massilia glaciei TaxID=1524097 RepID=A0A2U2HDG9_9BURK|nr:aspartyl beta-hydroxylase [Massilia glaciei]PWF41060.1 aspartyl beta-hydroxylase [Massilia glaciei]